MKLVLLAVGSPKLPGLAESIEDYESRISHYFNFRSIEVRPQRITAAADLEAIADRESRDLLAQVPPGLEVIAVDQRGERWSSEELAGYLDDLALHGKPGVAFLVGGTCGLNDRARRQADRVLALSGFTLPHELARLVLAEQLYRAGTIQRGEPYHRGG